MVPETCVSEDVRNNSHDSGSCFSPTKMFYLCMLIVTQAGHVSSLPESSLVSMSQHEEEIFAYTTFFWGQEQGSFLEMGAIDGETFSNTVGIFEQLLGWRGILIEASPLTSAMLRHRRPNQIGVNAAICGEAQDVHWADASSQRYGWSSIVSGIAEFMSQEHIIHSAPDQFFFGSHNASAMWKDRLNSLPVVRCVPLTSILQAFEAYHINFFVLDVEGSEMSVLSSLDWSCFSFDVLCIETQHSAEANDAIQRFLSVKGYSLWGGVPVDNDQNKWFTRNDFQPSQMVHP